ncbi:MAG: hypothetical protein U0V87_12850 [Acidobacteriota bacterium]
MQRSWFRRFIDANPDVPITDGRADFHLRGVPPLTACDGRLDLGTVLQARGKTNEAIAEWVKITTDCAESDALVHRAQERLQKVSGAAALTGNERSNRRTTRLVTKVGGAESVDHATPLLAAILARSAATRASSAFV